MTTSILFFFPAAFPSTWSAVIVFNLVEWLCLTKFCTRFINSYLSTNLESQIWCLFMNFNLTRFRSEAIGENLNKIRFIKRAIKIITRPPKLLLIFPCINVQIYAKTSFIKSPWNCWNFIIFIDLHKFRRFLFQLTIDRNTRGKN